MRCSTFLLVLAFMLAGCGGDDSGSSPKGPVAVSAYTYLLPAAGGAANPDGGAPVLLTISGRITFDRYLATAFGLDPSPVRRNAANVKVQLVRHDDPTQLLAPDTTANATGDYSFTVTTDKDFYVRARCESSIGALNISVRHSSMASPISHAVSSPIRNRALGTQTVDVNADLTMPQMRGGAFAALETLNTLAAVSAIPGTPPQLDVLWAPGNIGTSFMAAFPGTQPLMLTETRFINPSPLGAPGIILSGGQWNNVANSDHDEFDDTVLAHEFCHFLMRNSSRDNNWGGDHNGEALVPSAAYGEGLPTGLGCALLNDKNYIDTVGLPTGTTSVRFNFDCENPGFVAGVPSSVTGVSGYQSEFANAAVVWDLIDGSAGAAASTDGDPVAITLANFMASFNLLRTRNSTFDFAYLATLLQQLIDDAQLSAGSANTLVSPYNAAFPPTGADVWPPNITAPGTVNGTLDASTGPGGTPANVEIGPNANQCYRLSLASPRATTFNITVTTAGYAAAQHRVDFFLYDLSNTLMAFVSDDNQAKSVSLSLPAGEYLLRIQHAATAPAPVAFSVSIP